MLRLLGKLSRVQYRIMYVELVRGQVGRAMADSFSVFSRPSLGSLKQSNRSLRRSTGDRKVYSQFTCPRPISSFLLKNVHSIIPCFYSHYHIPSLTFPFHPDAAVPPWVGYNEEEHMRAQILQLSTVSEGTPTGHHQISHPLSPSLSPGQPQRLAQPSPGSPVQL